MIQWVWKQIRAIVGFTRQNFWQYRWQIALFVVLGFLEGALSSMGIGMVIPLFSFLVEGSGSGSDIISRTLEGFFQTLGIPFSLATVLGAIVVIATLSALISLLLGYLKLKITYDYENKLRQYLYQKTLRASWSYLLRQKIGYLESVLMGDMKASTALLVRLADTIIFVTSLLVYAVAAFLISPVVTLAALGVGTLALLASRPLITRTKHHSRALNRLAKSISHRMNEGVIGLKTIKASGVEQEVIAEGSSFFNELLRLRLRQASLSLFSSAALQPLGIFFIVALFALLHGSPGFNLGAFAATIYLVQRIFLHIGKLQSVLYSISAELPPAQIVIGYRREVTEHQEERSGARPFSFERELRFAGVGFCYAETNRPVLEDVRFSVGRGELVGIVGASGAGKTTLVDLLLRLFEPQQGQILLDGQNISGIDLAAWRVQVGYVSQDIFLRNDTLAENIRFFQSHLTDAEIMDAARKANIYGFIRDLPHGFQTVVGERGIHLSTGQRQRVVLARVLARHPAILVLDEATSALDNESEALIQDTIEHLKGEVTILVIAHRLSTIENADRVLVLQEGRIEEQGTPAALLQNPQSHFYRLYHHSQIP